jgi:hypothetical protein
MTSCSISAFASTSATESSGPTPYSPKRQPASGASPVVPGPNPGDTHTHVSSDRGHGQTFDHGDPGCVACQPRSAVDRRDASSHRPDAAGPPLCGGRPQLSTDPAQRPTGDTQLSSAVHTHDRQPKFGGSLNWHSGNQEHNCYKIILAKRLRERSAEVGMHVHTPDVAARVLWEGMDDTAARSDRNIRRSTALKGFCSEPGQEFLSHSIHLSHRI